jgi:hypothetical protein
MEALKKNVNLIGISILATLFILYNLSFDGDTIYCGTIKDINSHSLKSVKTEFLVVEISNGRTVNITGTEYYQTVGKPVEVIESTSLLGNKSYKLKNNATNSKDGQLKREC